MPIDLLMVGALFKVDYAIVYRWQSHDSHGHLPLYILCSAFGGPSPAGLTACTALPLPPRQLSPPNPTQPCPDIYASAERAKTNVLHVGVERIGKGAALWLTGSGP